MTTIYALLILLLMGLIDCLCKTYCKRKYNWEWKNVPDFWKSGTWRDWIKGRNLYEPLLFTSFGVAFAIYGIWHPITTLNTLLLVITGGLFGHQALAYWLCGTVLKLERAHWRMIQGFYPDFNKATCVGIYNGPDKLNGFELPPSYPWLDKWHMVGIQVVKWTCIGLWIITGYGESLAKKGIPKPLLLISCAVGLVCMGVLEVLL